MELRFFFPRVNALILLVYHEETRIKQPVQIMQKKKGMGGSCSLHVQ